MSRSSWRVGLLVGLCAVGGYFFLPGPGAKDVVYSAIGLASTGAVLAGSRLRRPVEQRGWYAMAAGNLCFVLGDGAYDVYQILHQPVPFPSVADACYLAGYPFLIVGVVCLTRQPGQAEDSRESYADAAIITIGALALSWHYLIASYTRHSTAATLATLVTLAYPFMDLGVVFIVVRGLVFGHARNAVLKLVAAAMVAMILSDFGYDLLSLHGAYATGDPVDAGWLVNYVLMGAAALYPVAAAGRSPVTARRKDSGARLPVVALAGFVAPVILLVATRSTPTDVSALAGISIILFALVVFRMRWMVARIASQTRSLEDALTSRDSLESALRHQAFHDSLTGLANRGLLHDRVDHALEGAHRTKGAVAVCFCDLDGFKAVNDNLGHLIGDAVLIAAGERLSAVVRPGDTVARLGGDEFGVLMEDLDGLGAAVNIAERIVSVLRQPMTVQGRKIGLSVSVGVAIAGPHATTERLLSSADAAMYTAKARGKDRLEVWDASVHHGTATLLGPTSELDLAPRPGEVLPSTVAGISRTTVASWSSSPHVTASCGSSCHLCSG